MESNYREAKRCLEWDSARDRKNPLYSGKTRSAGRRLRGKTIKNNKKYKKSRKKFKKT